MFLSEPELPRGCARIDPERMPTEQEVFDFLDMLRDSGNVNMLGAVPYIEHYLDVPRAGAKEYLRRWIDSFQWETKLENILQGKTND